MLAVNRCYCSDDDAPSGALSVGSAGRETHALALLYGAGAPIYSKASLPLSVRDADAAVRRMHLMKSVRQAAGSCRYVQDIIGDRIIVARVHCELPSSKSILKHRVADVCNFASAQIFPTESGKL